MNGRRFSASAHPFLVAYLAVADVADGGGVRRVRRQGPAAVG
jgi:hypothetical protein